MTWTERAEAMKQETHDALNLLWGELNHGQRQKLLRNEEVKALLMRYHVIEEG